MNTRFSTDGIITTNTDKDAFKINLPSDGLFQLHADPFSVGANNEGADLDIQLTLLNSNMKVVKVYNPLDQLNVSMDTTLMAGDYYIVVNGTGNANATNYGSLGSYRISGVYSPLTTTPVSQVLLSGESVQGKHRLNWSIISDQPNRNLSLESSFDGSVFTTLTTLSLADKDFTYEPFIKENIFYRLKVTSVTGKVSYSNIVPLKPVESAVKYVSVTRMITTQITVNAGRNYRYQLMDMSGRTIKTGSGDAGLTTINMNNAPSGIYIMQVLSDNERTTERIVKL